MSADLPPARSGSLVGQTADGRALYALTGRMIFNIAWIAATVGFVVGWWTT
jgi:hypothetical protein